jgi:hypothetical protein
MDEPACSQIAEPSLRDGDTEPIMVRDGRVIHFTRDMCLPRVEFVRRAAGKDLSTLDGKVGTINSKCLCGY